MKLLFDFFAKRSSTSLPRLFWAASLSGLSSALILYILNTGASHAAHGSALPKDNMQASLILPMGRLGPAFLAYPNFKVFIAN